MAKKPSLDSLKVSAKDTRSAREGLASRRGAQKAPPPRTKALTVKLTEADYKKLRKFAFDRHETHQTVLEAALIEYIEAHK